MSRLLSAFAVFWLILAPLEMAAQEQHQHSQRSGAGLDQEKSDSQEQQERQQNPGSEIPRRDDHQMPMSHDRQMPTMNPPESSTPMQAPPMRMPQSSEERLATGTQPSAPGMRLEQFEEMALSLNPTMAQAQDEIRAAEGRRIRAGLYPNPTIGYEGAEIRGGAFRGGEQGVFIRQDIVLGNKLGLSRRVFEQERQQAQAEAEEQKLRVLNGVRVFFYEALAAQSRLDLRRKLASLAHDAEATSYQLANVGQADRPDVLESEIEAQEAELEVITAEQNYQRAWRALAVTVGRPELAPSRLEGNLEELPNLDPQQWVEVIVRDSPAVKIAQLGIRRAEAALARAKREPVPDLQIKAGLEENRELQEVTHRPVGLQGFAEIGVQIPIFNRNQGNVQAATVDLHRAQAEVQRVKLRLREQAALLLQNYVIARATADRYRAQIIPRALKAYQLYLGRYKTMGAAYPQVLITQRTLFELQTGYISALENVWTGSVLLRGFMLTDGLEGPSRPGDLERPVREINLPSASATMSER